MQNRGIYQGFSSLEAFADHYRVFDPRRPVSDEEQFRRINWLHLVARAQEARGKANSYRDFRVGCAVWAFKTNAFREEGKWAVFTGSNLKVASDARPICAEQLALGAAKSGGYDRIIAIVVVGEPQQDAESGLEPPTLHPCGECRKIFQISPEISPKTFVVTLTPDRQNQEHFLIEELISLHQGANQRHRS